MVGNAKAERAGCEETKQGVDKNHGHCTALHSLHTAFLQSSHLPLEAEKARILTLYLREGKSELKRDCRLTRDTQFATE